MKVNLEKLSSRAEPEAGDYEEEGLLYCGQCRTPRECLVEIMGTVRRLPCMCGCRKEAYEKEQEGFYAEQQRLLINRLKVEGIEDKRLRACTFEADDGREPKKGGIFRRYVEQWERAYRDNLGLLLWGGVGTGKTFYAACVANALAERGVPVKTTNFIRLVRGVEAARDRNGYLTELDRYQLLVLDDLGAERGSAYMQEQVYDILDRRYRSGQPMVITTNLSLEELKHPEDVTLQRTYDRIMEVTVPVKFQGESRRTEKHRQKVELVRELLSEDRG